MQDEKTTQENEMDHHRHTHQQATLNAVARLMAATRPDKTDAYLSNLGAHLGRHDGNLTGLMAKLEA